MLIVQNIMQKLCEINAGFIQFGWCCNNHNNTIIKTQFNLSVLEIRSDGSGIVNVYEA